jgi:uncharacterized protein (DUF433 family)
MRRTHGGDRNQGRAHTRPVAFEQATSDSVRMGGLPVIRDTRVTVGMMLGQLASGRTTDEVLDDHP